MGISDALGFQRVNGRQPPVEEFDGKPLVEVDRARLKHIGAGDGVILENVA